MSTFNCNWCASFGSIECKTCTELTESEKKVKKRNTKKKKNPCLECKHWGKFTCRRCNE